MNTITKKMLLISFMLLSACAHYPQQYSYYPANVAYGGGYTIMHRNYYGERPHHYDSGYFPHHYHPDQYRAQPHNYTERRYQADRGNDHADNYENNRRHNDDDNHHNNFEHRGRR
ncbi:MAG: hypothetical protein ACXV8O_14015 [Methylobacter sp.]